MLAITRRTCLEGMLAATASVSLAPAALAQNLEDQSIARADTLIATGQPSGGAPTFTQYNDFNPLHPGLDLRSSIAFVLEPLFFYSVLSDKMIPWLAESYEYGENYTQITVHLRQGVTWNDGTPFGPDDVINTLDMLRRNGQGKADQLYASQMARDIKDLVRVDDHTVRIELNHRDPRWFFTFLTVRFTEGLFILPKHIYAATDPNELAGFTAMKPGPVGTGAFKITSMTPERIILDRRDDWWGLKTGFHPPAGDEACHLRAIHHARAGRPADFQRRASTPSWKHMCR